MGVFEDLINELNNEPWYMKLYRKVKVYLWMLECYLFNRKRNK
jgi:hypothetical protein